MFIYTLSDTLINTRNIHSFHIEEIDKDEQLERRDGYKYRIVACGVAPSEGGGMSFRKTIDQYENDIAAANGLGAIQDLVNGD